MRKTKAIKQSKYLSDFLPSATSDRCLEEQAYMPVCVCRHTASADLHMEICDGLIDMMAALFNVSGRQLRSPKRDSKDVARVRQIGMYIARVTLCLNIRLIADGFARDKSTVTHACHLIEDLRDDEEFDIIITRVEAVVSAAFKHALSAKVGDNDYK